MFVCASVVAVCPAKWSVRFCLQMALPQWHGHALTLPSQCSVAGRCSSFYSSCTSNGNLVVAPKPPQSIRLTCISFVDRGRGIEVYRSNMPAFESDLDFLVYCLSFPYTYVLHIQSNKRTSKRERNSSFNVRVYVTHHFSPCISIWKRHVSFICHRYAFLPDSEKKKSHLKVFRCENCFARLNMYVHER